MKKAFLVSILFSLASIIMSLWFKSLSASLFKKEELAIFYSVLDLVGLFMLVFIGFRSSMAVAYNKGADAAEVLNVFRIILAITTLVGLASSFFIVGAIGVDVGFGYLVLMFAAFAVYTYFSNQLGMYRLYAETNISAILESSAFIGWFYFVFYFLDITGTNALYLCAPLGMLSATAYIALKKMRSHPEPRFFIPPKNEAIKSFLKNSMLGGAEFVFGILVMYLAVVFTAKMLSLEALGEFQVVVKSFYMYFISIFIFPIVKFILPELSFFAEKGEFIRIKKLGRFALLYSFAAGLCAVLFSALFGEKLILWLFGDSYAPSYLPLVVMSASIFFATLNTYQVALLKSLDKFFLSMSVRACGSLLFPVFAYVVYSFYPTLTGVSVSLVLTYAAMSIISNYFSKRELSRLEATHIYATE